MKYDEEIEFFEAITTATHDYSSTIVSELEVVEAFGDGTFRIRATGKIMAVGTARKDPVDKRNVTIGSYLSMGRAFHNLGHRLLKRGNGLVKHADDIVIQKELQKKKKRKPPVEDAPPLRHRTTVSSIPTQAASPPASKKQGKTKYVPQITQREED